ncbi:ABC transporter permease subunit [Rhodobacteraceae bacterium 2CG4]|uniref:ABC transporter permease subunit n=2 Tax=Halovulum marinum TaxID=2662447 RepID=A0A6L5Z522_9RHOB|nr:ABC transporter permease [Halovulum marinum]MSU91409.1 ABC transporter permease subunit [Halovulum marinum]
MSWFTLAFFAVLILGGVIAGMLQRRGPLLLMFVLLCVSGLAAMMMGPGVLKSISIGAGILAAAAGISYMVRESLALLLPEGGARLIKTAPLTAVFGMLVIAVYILTAVFAPAIAPYGEAEVVGASFQPADETMLLGGDQLGRDLFSRLIFGARNTVGIALVTTAIAFVIGTLTGLIAASMGGWVDQILGRIVDTLLAIPQLIFALLLLTITGPSVRNLTLVIALLYAPLIFRLARAVAGGIVVMDYIEAARLRGERTWYVIMKEVLPNVTAPLAAEFGLRFCFVFLAISALSFLGLGIQPPTADWGSMVRENATLISFGAITPLIPAAAIALLTVAVNFVVDWMLHISSGLKE